MLTKGKCQGIFHTDANSSMIMISGHASSLRIFRKVTSASFKGAISCLTASKTYCSLISK